MRVAKRTRVGRRIAVALASALAVLAPATSALAYCRSAVCPDGKSGHVCVGDSPFYESALDEQCDDGLPLQWAPGCVGFAVQEDGTARFAGLTRAESVEATTRIAKEAFAAWQDADCDGGSPSIRVMDLGAVSCDRVEFNDHAGNASVIQFRDDAWPHDDTGGADDIALTTVHYDPNTGEIRDADIEINTATFKFATEDGDDGYDLLAVLTHETGHFLGLDHDLLPGETMAPGYVGASMRVLGASDQAGICAAYPPGRDDGDVCTGLEEHGFASACGSDQEETTCAFGRAPGDGVPQVGAAIALAAALRRVRRRGAGARAPRG